jgi:HEAT repeat protein
MTKIDEYRIILRSLDHWDAYLLAESGLPGPRGNIELAQAVADEGDRELFERYAAISVAQAPVNSPYEFLAFCGVVGLGRLLAEGDASLLETLRRYASDPRWRTREAVAMALQRLGDQDMDRLLAGMQDWSKGNPLEQRAAAAGLCEPRLLGQERHARAVLQILDRITATLLNPDAAPGEDRLVLR